MKRCVIFCAGELDAPVTVPDGALVIAADGGLQHTKKLGVQPDVILGDFDSLGYTPQGAEVFPVEKDDSDSMLAVRRGLAEGCEEFIFYGALAGKRLDHTVANFQTLQFLADRGAVGYLLGKDTAVTVVKNGKLVFPGTATGTLSVFCMGSDASGVTLQGFKYELNDGVLTAGHPLGLSNAFVGKTAEIEVKDGSLLVLWDRINGFPIR
ncbi:MAG: thiamine diphosphokinase [Oscillospiraceae bacterium]|nr:thiamine diphosphokinase [Oscillospiraceae bacterium]